MPMKDHLLKLIPEFNLIQDAGLREKCLAVWEEGMKLGGWKPEDLKRMPFTLLIDPCPATMVEHTRGNVLCCLGMHDALDKVYGKRAPLNRDILVAGALLHERRKTSGSGGEERQIRQKPQRQTAAPSGVRRLPCREARPAR